MTLDTDDRLDHRRAWDAIPWVVNGSADDATRRLVAAHVQVCADCRDEWEFQRRIHRGIDAAAAPGHDPGPALQRLWARVDRVEGESDTAPMPDAKRAWRWARWLAAAVVVQAIGLVALVELWREQAASGGYQTLSRPSPPGTGAATVRLVPAPGLAIGALPALLERAELQIVHSSGDGSILTLAPRAAGRLSTAQSLALLRAETGVRLAEPIGGNGTSAP